ncbi:MAG: hypothetical protein V1494_05950 [Candidatus Diapherotrites archaeon]
MQLGKLESDVLEALKGNGLAVFRARDVSLLLRFSMVKTYNLLKSLKKKGLIKSLQGGVYAVKGTDELAAGAYLNWPSYLSFWSALSYYGLTDQMPKTVFFASAKYKKRIGNCRFVVLSNKRFFGYTSVGGITIAEKEKAIIDSLLFPKYAGGMHEVFNAAKSSIKVLDLKKLSSYALRVKSRAAVRRLGFILEECGIRGKYLDNLLKRKGKGFELLDPSLERKNNFNKKWLLDVNW